MVIPISILTILALVIALLSIGLIISTGNMRKHSEATSIIERERELIKEDRSKYNFEISNLKSQLKEISKKQELQQSEIEKRNRALVGISKHYESETKTLQHHKNIEVNAVLRKYDVLINDYIKSRISELQLTKPNYKGAEQTLVDISDLTKAKKENRISPEDYLDELKRVLDNIQKA